MPIVTDINELDLNGTYTYADYLNWRFSEMVELFKGKIARMSPAPILEHQRITGRIFSELERPFRRSACQVFVAPFDVRLPIKSGSTDDGRIYTVVQPDVCVVCEASKLDKRGCIGAPDMVIEVLSPGNFNRDIKSKFALYEESGVKEYWIVSGGEKSVTVYLLDGEKYQLAGEYADPGLIPVTVLPGFSIEWSEVFT